MIKINDISFCYKGSKREVIKGLSLELGENKICGLLGKNGVGKSTLLYLICGLLHPRTGSVQLDGMEAKEGKPEMLQDMFIVTEDFSLPQIKLSEYVKMNRPFYPNFSEEVFNECLKEFEIAGNPNLKELSMGQKKKIYMSFALATGTKVLLMDEPTNGLDIPSKAQFRKVVSRSMTDERTIIISTHQVHDIDQLLDHVVIISQDGVLLNKSTAEICDEYTFEYRSAQDMDDVIYAEPTLQGNASMAKRNGRPETQLNLELLFNAVTTNKI